jgi:hypothetical protein
MRLVAALLAPLVLAAPSAADPPKLDILAFFSGHTHADNIIKIAFHSPHKLIVDSIGGRDKQGEFVLVDNVQEQGKPDRKRTWIMHPAGPNHFTGTLSDADGPVDVVVSGNSARIRYLMKDGRLNIDQQLTLEPTGMALNHVIARKFGIKFATVDGTIHKLD